MKTTHNNIISVAMTGLMLLFAIPMFAHNRGHSLAKNLIQKKHSSIEKRLQIMARSLSLTPEQITRIRPLFEAQDKEMKDILLANTSNHNVQRKEEKYRKAAEKEINRQTDRGNHDTMNKAIALSDSTFEKNIAGILTLEQNKKFLGEQKKR